MQSGWLYERAWVLIPVVIDSTHPVLNEVGTNSFIQCHPQRVSALMKMDEAKAACLNCMYGVIRARGVSGWRYQRKFPFPLVVGTDGALALVDWRLGKDARSLLCPPRPCRNNRHKEISGGGLSCGCYRE